MTNPTPSAEERAEQAAWRTGLCEEPTEEEIAYLAEQIRQAEQAARADERRKTLEKIRALECRECERGDEPTLNVLAGYYFHYPETNLEIGCPASKIISALANQPSEPGEAA